MLPYITLLFIIVVLAIFLDNRATGNRDLFLFGSVLILVLFSGLASSRGDYISYKTAFENPFENSGIEKGFHVFNYVVKSIGGGYHLLLILASFVAVSLKMYSFHKLTPFAGIAAIAYVGSFYVPADMGSLRFGWAMGFLLFSIPYIHKRNLRNFSCVILLGSLFHSALVIVFIFYLLCTVDLKRNHYIIILSLSVVVFLTADMNKIISFTQRFAPNEYNVLLKALNYLDNKAHMNFALTKRIFIFILVSIFYVKLERVLPYFKILYNAYFFSIVVFFAFATSYYLANRTSWLFASVEPVLLSGFFKVSNDAGIRFLIFAGIVLFSLINIYSIVLLQTDAYNLYYPYKLFFL
jgi:hypothetical protein